MVELNPLKLSATLHQRRMQNQTYGNIIWGRGRFSLRNASYVTFKVQPPPERDNMKVDHHALGEAEAHMRRKEFAAAAALLKPMAAASALAKKMLWDCYVELDDIGSIVAEYYPPSSASEIIYMLEKLWEHDPAKLRELLDLDIVKSSTDKAVVPVRDKYNTRMPR